MLVCVPLRFIALRRLKTALSILMQSRIRSEKVYARDPPALNFTDTQKTCGKGLGLTGH
jgi:hypothetical protein